MRHHDRAGDEQTQADTARGIATSTTGERLEDEWQDFGRDRRTPITDGERHHIALLLRQQCDGCSAPVLDCISQEVRDNLRKAVGIPIADLLTGMWGAFGFLAALQARERTGRVQQVENSLLESMVGTATSIVLYMNGTRKYSFMPEVNI